MPLATLKNSFALILKFAAFLIESFDAYDYTFVINMDYAKPY